MENVLKFITNNSATLITIIIAIIALVKAIISKNKQQIYANIYSLITEAEQLQQSNTDKFNFVLDKAYNTLPKILKFFISKDDISRAIEYSLNKLKDYAKIQISANQSVTVQEQCKTE